MDAIAEAAFWTMEADTPEFVPIRDIVCDHEELGLVFPALTGNTLRGLLRIAGNSARPLAEGVAARIALDVAGHCAALERTGAEGRGYGFGAITPESLFVDRTGWARLVDVGASSIGARQALHHWHIGGASSFAPEQLDGMSDARTHVFALGLIVWEVLAIRRPRYAATFESLCDKIRSRSYGTEDRSGERDIEDDSDRARETLPTIPES